MKRTDRIFHHLTRYWLTITLGALPLFFIPFVTDFYDFGKWMLLLFASAVVLFVWALRGILIGSFPFHWTPVSRSLLFLTIAYCVSIIAGSPNRIEAVLTPFGIGIFACMLVISLFGSYVFDDETVRSALALLTASAAIVAVLSVYQFFGMGSTLFASIPFLSNQAWTPAGSVVGLFGMLSMVLPVSIGLCIHLYREKHEVGMSIAGIGVLTLFVGVVLAGITLSRNIQSTVLPITATWSVLLETLKNPLRALVGIGSENYVSAFTSGRPLFLNQSPAWNIRFLFAGSGILHIATTVGLLGLAASLYLVLSLFGQLRKEHPSPVQTGVRFGIAVGIIAFLLLPANFLVLIVLLVLTFLHDASSGKSSIFRAHALFPQLPFLTGSVTLLAVIVLCFFTARAVYADSLFYRSLEARKADDAKSIYNLQVEAINANPYISRYHTVFSQTGLAVANGILSSAARSRDASLSATQRDTATRLVDQSIKEAKKAIALSPSSVLGWENLASLYESLLGVAGGDVGQWTIAAYQQAIQLDPTNPIIRYVLGTVYMKLQDPATAAQYYQQALTLKPDYTFAHFGLAKSLRARKDPVKAAMQLQYLKTLLPPASENLDTVNAEISATENEMTREEKTSYDKLLTQFLSQKDTAPQQSEPAASPLSPLP